MTYIERRTTAIERYVGRRALRATARYSWRRFVARAEQRPLRSVTLLGVGGAVGLVAGWLAGRSTAPTASQPPMPTTAPTASPRPTP